MSGEFYDKDKAEREAPMGKPNGEAESSLAELAAEADEFFPVKPQSRVFGAAYRDRMHAALDVILDRMDKSTRIHAALDRILQERRCTGDREFQRRQL
jgi:hypothetical protein